MLDVITRRSNLELMLQIGAEVLVSEDPRHRGDHPDPDKICIVMQNYASLSRSIIDKMKSEV